MSAILFHPSPRLSSIRNMGWMLNDDVPSSLIRDQMALGLWRRSIRTLPLGDPRISAYTESLDAHAQRVTEFAAALRQRVGPSSPTDPA